MLVFRHVEALKNLLNAHCDAEYHSLDVKPDFQKGGNFGVVNYEDSVINGACDKAIKFAIIYVGNNFNDLEKENEALEQLMMALELLSVDVVAFDKVTHLGTITEPITVHLGKDKELRRIYKTTFEMSV